MKEVEDDELRESCLVNDRTLMDILREYVGLCNEIKKLCQEYDRAEYNKSKFEPPVKLLRFYIMALH